MNKFNKAVKQLLGLSVMMALMSPAHATDDLPKYEKVSGLSGNLSSVGSDTLASLATRAIDIERTPEASAKT